MTTLALTYFDFPGGRAEPTRLALKLGNIPFEDIRFTFDKFPQVRENTPLKQVPVLEVDGKQITQTNAINRYVAKMANLYPQDDFQALLCDEVMDALEDTTHKLVATFGKEGEELKAAREALYEQQLAPSLRWLEQKLADAGGEYFADNRLTIADLKVFVWVRSLSSGMLDHIPTDAVATNAPSLIKHMQRIAANETIKAHYG